MNNLIKKRSLLSTEAAVETPKKNIKIEQPKKQTSSTNKPKAFKLKTFLATAFNEDAIDLHAAHLASHLIQQFAPIILSLAPCAAMCAMSICCMKGNKDQDSTNLKESDDTNVS